MGPYWMRRERSWWVRESLGMEEERVLRARRWNEDSGDFSS